MELGVRDWMIIIGVLLIAAVLLDGFRRMRNERRGNIRMSLNKQFLNAGAADELKSSELPNGGARTVGREGGGLDGGDAGPELGDGQLDLQQAPPVLMESVEEMAAGEGEYSEPLEAVDPEVITEPAANVEVKPVTKPTAKPTTKPITKPTAQSSKKASSTKSSDVEEVVVINLVAKDKPFKGPDLLHILLACDMRFGDMNIFHRHEEANGTGAVQFSMANSVEPGIFDLDSIDDFSTPGVCFFMSVPGPERPNKAFEYMVETAQCLASNLNGEMLDESRSAMTNQTLEHCRQRIRDFERRQLTQHA